VEIFGLEEQPSFSDLVFLADMPHSAFIYSAHIKVYLLANNQTA
jgi:hypothetical protein